MSRQLKVVGNNGQISLGKEFAGKTVMLEKLSNGTLVIKPGTFIPDSEKWIYENDNLEKISKAIKWSENNPIKDNFDELIKEIEKKIGD